MNHWERELVASNDLRHHLCSHQRPPTQDSAVESAGGRLARRGADGCDRCDDARARLSRRQLRHAGAAARDDAHLGLSVSRALFRMGGRTVSEFSRTPQRLLLYLTFTSGVLSALLGERHDLPDADPLVVAVIRRGKLPLLPFLIALATSANIGSVATLVGNPQNMIIGHLLAYSIRAIFAQRSCRRRLLGWRLISSFYALVFATAYGRRQSTTEPHAIQNSIAVCL